MNRIKIEIGSIVCSLSLLTQSSLCANMETQVENSNLQQFNAIVQKYEEQIQHDPQNLKLITAVADVYYSLREYQKAIVYYRQALELDPKSLSIKANLGLSYLNTNNFVESKTLFDEILIEDPHNTSALAGLGRIEALKQHTEEAEEYYKQALSHNPNDPTTLFYYSDLLIEEKHYEKAENILTELQENDPKANWISQSLKRAKFGPIKEKIEELEKKGDFPAAIAMMETASRKDPDNLEILLALSKLYVKNGNPDQAIQLLEKAQKKFPTENSINLALGFTYLEKKDYFDAEYALQSALRNDSNQPEALAGLGRIAALNGDFIRADKLYQKALESSPFNTLALSYLAQLRIEQKRYSEAIPLYEKIHEVDRKETWTKLAIEEAKLAPLLDEIALDEKRNQYRKVESLYEQIIQQFPRNENNYVRFAQFYRKHKRYQKAIDISIRGITINPDSIPLYINLGYDYLFNGQLEESEQAFKYVLSEEPKNVEALRGLGRLYALAGDLPAANLYYDWALKIDPKDIATLSYLIDLRMQEKNYAAVKKLAAAVLEINPKELWAKDALQRAQNGPLYDEIESLEKTGHFEEAIQLSYDLMRMAPESEDGYLGLGRIYNTQKRFQKATEIYLKGLQLVPQSSQLRINLGLVYLELNKLKEAQRELEQADSMDPGNADAIAGLGRIAYLNGDIEGAKEAFTNALEINSRNLLALSYLASLYMHEKSYAKAEQLYKQILAINSSATWAKEARTEAESGPLLQQASEYTAHKMYPAAEKIYRNLIVSHPNNPNYYLKLGQFLVQTKQYAQAMSLYPQAIEKFPDSTALKLAFIDGLLKSGNRVEAEKLIGEILYKDPSNAEALTELGLFYDLNGNSTQAIAAYESALKQNPDNITALAYLSKLLIQNGSYAEAQKIYQRIQTLQPTAEWVKAAMRDAKYARLFVEINKSFKAEDFKAAEVLWQQLLREEPNVPDYYLRFGLFYHQSKQNQKAIDTYKIGLALDPTSTDLYAALGLVYLSMHEYEKANGAFKKALKYDPNNPDALAGLGYVYLTKENFTLSEKYIKAALEIDPERIAALSSYGDLLMKEKRYPEAVTIFEKLKTLRPKEKWIQLSLEDAQYGTEVDAIKELIDNDQFSEAAEGYEKLLERSPDNAHFYYGLGQMYMRLRQYGKSIQVNLDGLQKNPEENELRIALGYAYFFSKQYPQARRYLEKAIELDHKNPEALAGLGRVFALEGDQDQAEALYIKALAIDPKNTSAMSFYGNLLMRQRRFDEAQEVFSHLAEILPNAEWVKRAVQDAKDGPMTVIANALADEEEFELAAGLYQQLIDNAPDDPARYLPLGQMFVNLQCYCAGLEVFFEGLQIDNEAPYLWRAVGTTYILLEEFCAAEEIFYALIESDDEDAESWAGLGRVQALNGTFCLANEYYYQALVLEPFNVQVLSYLADLQLSELYPFSALDTYETIIDAVENDRGCVCEPLPKWITRGLNNTLFLTAPTLVLAGDYHEEKQWDPTLHRWSAEYQVYGGSALFNYPISDPLTIWGKVADQFYDLKDLLTRRYIYSFDVQRFYLGARWVFNPCLFLDVKAGLTNYSPYRCSTFHMKTGTIPEPSVVLTYHTPTQKATLGIISSSDLVARDFATRDAKLVGYYGINGTYETRIIQRGWIGFEANATWYNDFVHNNSQRLAGWFQWRPPFYPDNILFRYYSKYQTFAKNIPDYYTYKPQYINQLQMTLEKSWRVCWADTFYTSLSYAHGWQNTHTRFPNIIVIVPVGTQQPYVWDNRQFNIVTGSVIYKRGQLAVTLAGDYYQDSEKYTIWNIGFILGWRF